MIVTVQDLLASSAGVRVQRYAGPGISGQIFLKTMPTVLAEVLAKAKPICYDRRVMWCFFYLFY